MKWTLRRFPLVLLIGIICALSAHLVVWICDLAPPAIPVEYRLAVGIISAIILSLFSASYWFCWLNQTEEG